MPHFVTSRQEDDHVTSANTAHWNAGTLGNGCYVLPIGSKLACTMTDSNTLRVLFGVGSVCGRQWEIEGDYEEVNIDNGVPGYNRTDLLVCRIETAPQETIELKVYKGDETTGTPVVPGHVEGDLNDGDTVCEMPICSVRINGINPQAPEMLAKESIDIMALLEELRDYKSQNDETVETAQSTADGAVSVNTNQNTRLTALEKSTYKAVGGVEFVRRGDVVTAFFSSDVNYTAAVWTDLKICDIPVGFRPSRPGFGTAVWPGGSGRMIASTNKTLFVVTMDKAISKSNIWGEVTYFTDDA